MSGCLAFVAPPQYEPARLFDDDVKRERLEADDAFRERVRAAGLALRDFLLVARIDLTAT